MSQYTAKPVTVTAHRIVGVGALETDGSMHLALENGQNVIATPRMLARYSPLPWDYWVIQQDGYEYLNPAAVFERRSRRAPAAPKGQ
jgi:hypothetical protein